MEEMSFIVLVAITLVSSYFLVRFLRGGSILRARNLPRGSLGFPVFGETLSYIRARKEDRAAEWIDERVSKHGPVFKTSILGSPTVVVTGQAGNKFALGSNDDVLVARLPKTFSTIAGKSQLFGLSGARYKMVKEAMLSFLKPESLQNNIKYMDDLVKTQLKRETQDKETIMAVSFLKKLTFNVTCAVLFGIHDEHTKQALLDDFFLAMKAIISIPINFPGTTLWKGMQARSRINKRLLPIIQKKREELLMGTLSPRSDVITCLLSLREEHQEPLNDEEIMDNFIGLLTASHDTTTILLSLMMWKLARDPSLYHKIVQEQMEIVSERQGGEETLTWSEIQKMKYTWRVAQEIMRIIPPAFGGFRKAVKDISFGAYDIPKGWQVLWVAHGTHMNKDIFDDPTVFNPSRFESPSKPIPPFAYVAFGGGLHRCIGNEFARVETLTILHHLVTKFEWSQVYPDEVITRQPTPYPSMGLPIKLKAKK